MGFLETRFSHMHIHDNNGKRDAHDTIGEGTIDFGPVVAALRRTRASSVLEVRSLEGVKASIAVLERL